MEENRACGPQWESILSTSVILGKMLQIKDKIQNNFSKLYGQFVIPKNGYEKHFCSILDWKAIDNRYYDAYDGTSYIELKKGQNSMYFDLVRYAEIVVGKGTGNTITVFLKWNKQHMNVTEAMVIDTTKIIEFFNITLEKALTLIELHKYVPRQLNILASATASDLRKMSTYIVTTPTIYEEEIAATLNEVEWPKIMSIYIYISTSK